MHGHRIPEGLRVAGYVGRGPGVKGSPPPGHSPQMASGRKHREPETWELAEGMREKQSLKEEQPKVHASMVETFPGRLRTRIFNIHISWSPPTFCHPQPVATKYLKTERMGWCLSRGRGGWTAHFGTRSCGFDTRTTWVTLGSIGDSLSLRFICEMGIHTNKRVICK